jgi:hypothetical protein
LHSKSNHYVAYINHKDIGWYEYNDLKVAPKEETQILSVAKKGYYFVYQRQDGPKNDVIESNSIAK